MYCAWVGAHNVRGLQRDRGGGHWPVSMYVFCVLKQILRATPRSHCHAPLRLPLPPSHCNATTADRTATSRCLFLTRRMPSQARRRGPAGGGIPARRAGPTRVGRAAGPTQRRRRRGGARRCRRGGGRDAAPWRNSSTSSCVAARRVMLSCASSGAQYKRVLEYVSRYGIR